MAAEAEEIPAPPLPAAVRHEAPATNPDPPEQHTAEEEDGPRDAKRRRSCPAVLDKVGSFKEGSLSDGGEGFSFSFDTAGIAPIETTPRFGSFNHCPSAEKREDDAGGNREKEEGQNGNTSANDEGRDSSRLELKSSPVEGKTGI